jgi:hypothetical protein
MGQIPQCPFSGRQNMVRIFAAFFIMAFLASCGGTPYSSNNAAGIRASASSQTLYASGPIASACRAAGRKEASRARCGCVQAVANRSLSSSEQLRGMPFFNNPQRVQDLRKSDTASNKRFWRKWKEFGTQASRMCT